MDNRVIDKRINSLVREKMLLLKSLKVAKSEEVKGIKKRIIEINGLIYKEKSKYKEGVI